MKRIILGLVLLYVWGCGKNPKEAVISGKVPGEVQVVRLFATDRNNTLLCEDTVDVNGIFCLKHELQHPSFWLLASKDHNYRARLFVHPGEKQTVNIETNGDVTFEGDGAGVNRFERLVQQKQQELNHRFKPDYTNPDAVLLTIRQRTDSLLAFVDQASLSDMEYKETQKCLLRLDMYNSLFNLPMAMRLFVGKDTILPPSFYNFATEFRFGNPALRNIDQLNDYLKEYFGVLEKNDILKAGITDFLQKRAEWIADPVVRENYLIAALSQEVSAFNQQLPEIFPLLEPLFTTESNRQKFQELQERYRQLNLKYAHLGQGNPAFDFIGRDIDNQPCSLKEYLGKVVVVDVWSTNCIPCIAEIPYLQKLEQKFKGEEVVFISYSIDIRWKKWADFVRQKALDGIQLVDTLGPKSEFMQHYAIHSTPRIFLFDKDGTIADVFAPRPSDPRLALKIKSLLDDRRTK